MSKKKLNKENLEALGADRLAALLLEVSTGSADIKRRLRLELSHNLGSADLAHEVRKRLVSLRKSTSFVSWRKRKALVKDLSVQAAMIIEKIAPDDPATAFDLLWQFIEMAPFIYGRVDDSRGEVGDVFRSSLTELADIAPRAQLEQDALVSRIWNAIEDNGHGEWDGIIGVMAAALGPSGLTALQAKVHAYAQAPMTEPDEAHDAIQFLRQLRGGPSYAAEQKARFVKWCLQEIAAVSGDTDAYVAQYSETDLARKDIAAEVAGLLLDDGRPSDALKALNRADMQARTLGQAAWDDAYIACLDALGHADQAQAHRWACFKDTLNPHYLRDHLKKLPDFDDIEAEEAAKAYVKAFANLSGALLFCLNWPDAVTAAHLVETRTAEIDGNQYTLLPPLADMLRDRHPRAAALVWRAMIDYTLGQRLSSRYGHAAHHLADCGAVDMDIADYGAWPTHQQYVAALEAAHDRKTSFWAKVL